MDTLRPAAPATMRPWPAAVVLAGAMFLVLFDSLAVATALPRIGAEFGVSPGRSQWVVTLYSLSIGGFLVLGGRLCDLLGRRRLIVASLALTALGLLVSGLAPTLAVLLTGRVLQGVGAAVALPAALASAATLFPEEPWRSRVFSVVATAANAAGLAGAVCGGLVTSYLGWRWVFLAGLPVAVLCAGAARIFLPADEPADEPADGPADEPADGPGDGRGRLDVLGAVLVTGGILAVMYGASRIGEAGPAPATVLPVVVGLVLFVAFAGWERRVSRPLVPAAVVRSRRLVGSCLAFGAHSAAYAAVVVVGSLLLQDVHGLSAAQAGLALAPVLLLGVISAAPAGRLVRRYGSRRVVAGALVLCSVALAVAAIGSGSLPLFVIALAAWGLSGGPIYVALTRECVGDAAPHQRGIASALFESTSHIGGAIAVAVYLTMIGAGAGYGPAQLVGAAVSGAAVVATLLVMPRRAR
jgi:MFS family permease